MQWRTGTFGRNWIRCQRTTTHAGGSVASAKLTAQFGRTACNVSLLYTQQSTEYPSLTVQVLPRDAEDLPFPNHVRCLDPLNHHPRRAAGSWPLHRSQAAFDVTVIGFDPIIAVAASSLPAMPPDLSLGTHVAKRIVDSLTGRVVHSDRNAGTRIRAVTETRHANARPARRAGSTASRPRRPAPRRAPATRR